MILAPLSRFKKSLALLFLTIFYCDFVLANYNQAITYASYLIDKNQANKVIKDFIQNELDYDSQESSSNIINNLDEGKQVSPSAVEEDGQLGAGPTQPEMQSFQSVNSNNMVDLFSGDFSYNIPLLDVGGYPVNISYRSGITMDQEASWVGLGWNINPGTITRNMRGLPDDFNGTDTMTQVTSTKENKTVGVSGGTGFELFGKDLNLGLNGGLFVNNYRGFGLEYGLSVDLSSSLGGKGIYTGGLSLKSNSQEGVTLEPSLSYQLTKRDADQYFTGNVTIGSAYNSRTGLKSLQMSSGLKQYTNDKKNQTHRIDYDGPSGAISFAYPSYSPRMTSVHTSRMYSFTAKVGVEQKGYDPNGYITGYVSTDKIEGSDTLQRLPAYGVLNYQNAAGNANVLLDYNREKEIPYREKPYVPNIAVPSYTYDVFSITGEGIGGMFRAYRGDVGYVFDHSLKSKDASVSGSLDLGFGDLIHAGLDINVTHAYTQNGPASNNNYLIDRLGFKKSDTTYESVYFRNPGEKSINSKEYYDAIGGDDVITANLKQNGINDSRLIFDSSFRRYVNKKYVGNLSVPSTGIVKKVRDKRTQVITYLTADEASKVGFSKYIENYKQNSFEVKSCNKVIPSFCSTCGGGLTGEYFNNKKLEGTPLFTRKDATIHFSSRDARGNAFPKTTDPSPYNSFNNEGSSIRWTGQLFAPETGTYYLRLGSDDGANLFLNDSILINQGGQNHSWDPNNLNGQGNSYDTINLVAGQFYDIRIEHFQGKGNRDIHLFWKKPSTLSGSFEIIPSQFFYTYSNNDVADIDNAVSVEKRINTFRKANHISEVDVLNNDGRKYVYGIPVYNLKQKEISFAINNGDATLGTTNYSSADNKTNNSNGQDNFYSSQETPAYAHSFLLTAIVSPDYVDQTGDGITEDDMGDAIKFNYTKIAGVKNPYRWRTPYTDNSNKATYNEGLKTDNRDDKANYVYGEKEEWYLNSIESKNMIAVFIIESRKDLWPIAENGAKVQDTLAKRLREIDLYTKADFEKGGAKPIKTVHFEYSYDLCKGISRQISNLQDSGKLTLKRIWFSYNGNNKGQRNPYIFNYNSTNPNYSDTAYDRWSNYKSSIQNPGSKSGAGNLVTNADYPYAIQSSFNADGSVKPNDANKNCAAWTLDSIILPSGGRIKVSYESDDYAYVQNKRAMQMFQVKGFASSPSQTPSFNLYDNSGGKLYVFAKVNKPVSSNADVFNQYLQGVDSIYFKLFVQMPTDKFGKGSEYVPCYASVDKGGGYGFIDPFTIWFKVKGIKDNGELGGSSSPLSKAAISFLRLNLNSKAYPGSETGTNPNLADAIKLLAINANNIKNVFTSFDNTAKANGWVNLIDTSRSLVRLDNPDYKKLGGGLRVKRISIYDNWNTMSGNAGANPSAGQRSAVYGQEYTYTTTKQINGKTTTISSGVASYEPVLGGEENPWHVPIQYVEQAALLAPISLGYTEEPLGENFFPSPSIGYSKVRVRTINVQNRRSANGYEETTFYTTYDFPTITDRTVIDRDTKKRYKPAIANFLRINAKHYLAVSQGFKIDLNDMNGKIKSQATYPETDSANPISYTENFYKVDNPQVEFKHLANTVWAIDPSGNIDTTAIIGKDIEIMTDMRKQYSYTLGNTLSPNLDALTIGVFPLFILTAFHLPKQEENDFRSVATTKVINRFGILDSVVHIENGSLVSTKNLLYDAETGDVLLTRTQNEYEDPVYNFTYPSHWAYDGMGEAYRNISAVFNHLEITNGKITSGLPSGRDNVYFAGGDELLAFSHEKTGDASYYSTVCDEIATWPTFKKLWTIDSAVIRGGQKSIYVIDENGIPFTGHDVSTKIIRSGRRNINTSVGSVTMLQNPLLKSGGNYTLQLTTAQKVLNASAVEYKQLWKVNDRKVIKYDSIPNGCPIGYQYSSAANACVKDTAVIVQDTFRVCYIAKSYPTYSSCGSFIYSSFDTTNSYYTRSKIADLAPGYVWINSPNSWRCEVAADTIKTQSKSTTTTEIVYPDDPPLRPRDTTQGPMNRSAIWTCKPGHGLNHQFFGFTVPLTISSDGYYYLGMGADNYIAVTIDGVTFRRDTLLSPDSSINSLLAHFQPWHIYKKFFSKGIHTIKIEAANEQDESTTNVVGVGVEIYNNTESQLRNATKLSDLNIIFSTADLDHTTVPATYTCPIGGYSLAQNNSNQYVCRKYTQMNYSQANSCISAITDTLVNPYVSGILGNWRVAKNYVYYTDRTEKEPTTITNIRINGTYDNFSPFWKFVSNKLVSQADTSFWVWNSESTLFNKKGFELENRDPLNRYNAGLYGYNMTLPTGVIQNGKYRQSGYDGFEDYSYVDNRCDTVCSTSSRQLDYSPWQNYITTAEHHTGKYSIGIKKNFTTSIALSFPTTVNSVDEQTPVLKYTAGTYTCQNTSSQVLQSIRADKTALLPAFQPSPGDSLVVSAWVSEGQDCKCTTFNNDSIIISVSKSGGGFDIYTAKPAGAIIEGWQRIEAIVPVSLLATTVSLTLQTNGNYDTYFDDIRIHPYHANMKSFVYDPVTLRLMAELDENNYASFYEYDDDGTLVRIKKETERGIKTIKETRSTLLKNNEK